MRRDCEARGASNSQRAHFHDANLFSDWQPVEPTKISHDLPGGGIFRESRIEGSAQQSPVRSAPAAQQSRDILPITTDSGKQNPPPKRVEYDLIQALLERQWELPLPTIAHPPIGTIQEGIPLFDGWDHPHLTTKFVQQGYQDVWAGVLFVLTVLACVVWGIYNVAKLKTDFEGIEISTENSLDLDPGRFVKALSWCLPAAFGAATGLGILSIILMRAYPSKYIVISNVTCDALMIAGGTYLIVTRGSVGGGSLGCGITLLLLAALYGLWIYVASGKIPFAGAVLRHSVTTVCRHRGTLVTGLLSVLVIATYGVMWLLMTVPTLVKSSRNIVCDDSILHASECTVPGWIYALWLLFFFMLFWTVQVVINVVHVTAAGTVATWYFAGTGSTPPNPSLASFKRAMTLSFGSICLGSSIVAILELIRGIFKKYAEAKYLILGCIAWLIVTVVEFVMEYFNLYAFTYIAIFGSSYVQAAKQTWKLMADHACAPIFNDSLIFTVLGLNAFMNSLLVGILLGVAAGRSSGEVPVGIWAGTMSFFASFLTLVVIFRVVYSGVATIFVCVAECPDANPEVYGLFTKEIDRRQRNDGCGDIDVDIVPSGPTICCSGSSNGNCDGTCIGTSNDTTCCDCHGDCCDADCLPHCCCGGNDNSRSSDCDCDCDGGCDD